MSVLAVMFSVATLEFYPGGEEASDLEATLYGVLEAIVGPLFVGLILLTFVAFVAAIARSGLLSTKAGRRR